MLAKVVRTSNGDVMRFSTVRTTPSLVLMPTAVDPSCTAWTAVKGTAQ